MSGFKEHTIEATELSIFMIFCALLIGQMTKHCTHWIGMPYTPVLTVLGVIVAAVDRSINSERWTSHHDDQHELEHESIFRITLEGYHTPDPSLVFLIFLPALIFESAFNTDWYTFKRQFLKILIMAMPLLLFSTFMTALIMYYVLGFSGDANNLSFMGCLIFGAIISATDPVAVVALLKELGVSKQISTLIEGESLMNDGTALVLFIVLEQIEEGKDLSAWDITKQFVQMSVGGPLLGLVFGFIMAWMLNRIHNVPIMEANLTVCMPYILFYVAELHAVHVSGILALVAMGLYMTNRGRTRISTESEETIHAIWSYIGFVAETLIFLLTGIVLGGKLVDIEPIWFLQLIGLYIVLHIIRFVGLLITFPLMRRTGYTFDIKQAVLVSYSGLRGAVGLCLALLINFNANISTNIQGQIMFFTCGIVLLTLIVNGTTTGILIRKLGLAKEN